MVSGSDDISGMGGKCGLQRSLSSAGFTRASLVKLKKFYAEDGEKVSFNAQGWGRGRLGARAPEGAAGLILGCRKVE